MTRKMAIAGAVALLALAPACAQRGNNVQAANAGRNAATAQPANTSAAERTGNGAQTAAAPATNQEIELISEGFSSGAQGLHHSNMITFGQSRDQVVGQLSAILGQPAATGRNEECPSGAVDFVRYGSLDVHFEDGRLAGWVLDGAAPALKTYHGLAIGTRRSDLVDELEAEVDANSTLGTEVSVNGVGALLSGPGRDATVTTLFAGVTCFAR